MAPGTFSATLKTAGNQTITATDTSYKLPSRAPATPLWSARRRPTHFAVSAPACATAGTAFSFTVTALDQFNNTATGYAGTVHFTSTRRPGSTAGQQHTDQRHRHIQRHAEDGWQSDINRDGHGDSSHHRHQQHDRGQARRRRRISRSAHPLPRRQVRLSASRVTAQDQFNNTATGYAGTVHFTSSDGQAVLPANGTLTSGTGTFSATLKTAAARRSPPPTPASSITGTSNAIQVTRRSHGTDRDN